MSGVRAASGGRPGVGLGRGLGEGRGRGLGGVRAEGGGSGPLGEVLAAGGAAEAADTPLLTGPAVGAEIALPLVAVGGAVGVGASESGPVVLAHCPLLSGCPAHNSLANQMLWRQDESVPTRYFSPFVPLPPHPSRT